MDAFMNINGWDVINHPCLYFCFIFNHHWSYCMDEWLHPNENIWCNYLSMQQPQVIFVDERGSFKTFQNIVVIGSSLHVILYMCHFTQYRLIQLTMSSLSWDSDCLSLLTELACHCHQPAFLVFFSWDSLAICMVFLVIILGFRCRINEKRNYSLSPMSMDY